MAVRMKLVIFDLDQTLVDFIDAHDRATGKLFREFFGVDARLREIDFAGRSLLDNFADLARLKGVPEEVFQRRMGACLETYETILAREFPADGRPNILPGARELLDALAARGDCVLALYTGGSRGIVDLVLSVTGLGEYFQAIACGPEAGGRAGVARLAVQRAQAESGVTFPTGDIVVIGDSVRDVECGKQLGARTIAVGTGFHSESQLLQTGPDHLFKDLRPLAQVMAAIFDSKGEKMSKRVVKSDEEWRQTLTPQQYAVAREKATEPPFTGKYAAHKGEGRYLCMACGNELFSSETKYDSGSGWPSFWAPLSEDGVSTTPDTSEGMVRTEVACSRCGAHLGHLFNDGPPPTGLRYCINSISLDFVPAKRRTGPGKSKS